MQQVYHYKVFPLTKLNASDNFKAYNEKISLKINIFN